MYPFLSVLINLMHMPCICRKQNIMKLLVLVAVLTELATLIVWPDYIIEQEPLVNKFISVPEETGMHVYIYIYIYIDTHAHTYCGNTCVKFDFFKGHIKVLVRYLASSTLCCYLSLGL